jgi:hypothetical protein
MGRQNPHPPNAASMIWAQPIEASFHAVRPCTRTPMGQPMGQPMAVQIGSPADLSILTSNWPYMRRRLEPAKPRG